jgi:hypothetical protein
MAGRMFPEWKITPASVPGFCASDLTNGTECGILYAGTDWHRHPGTDRGGKPIMEQTLEQTPEQMRDRILEARKLYSGRQLDTNRTGAISRMEKGEKVSPVVVARLYRRLLELEQEQKAQTPEQMGREEAPGSVQVEQKPEQTPGEEEEMQALRIEMKGMRDEIAALRAEVSSLRERQGQKEQKAAQTPEERKEQKGQTVLGWRIGQKVTAARGYSYRKYFARKGTATIYLGSSPEGAEAKIREWLERKGQTPEQTREQTEAPDQQPQPKHRTIIEQLLDFDEDQ